MQLIKLLIAAFLIPAAVFISCTREDETAEPEQKLSLEYKLVISAMHPESLHVLLTVNMAPAFNSFILPFIYGDNPLDSLSGAIVTDLSVTGRSEGKEDFSISKKQCGPVYSEILEINDKAEWPVTFNYRINLNSIFNDTANKKISLIFLNSESGFITGNYLFMAPYAPDIANLWRNTHNITLDIINNTGTELYGVHSKASYGNIYELIFVQVILGAQVTAKGNGGGQNFGLYSFPSAVQSPVYMYDSVAHFFSSVLESIVPAFESLDENEYCVLFHAISGGMEGTHSFISRYPHVDPDSTIAMVFAHEAYHHMIGIRCGDLDDPWWKEGTANYLGYAKSAELNLSKKSKVYDRFVRPSSLNDAEKGHSPSEEYVRENQYALKLYRLTYTKGGQISMLMDEAIRKATDNSITLHDATAELCKEYLHSAFNRGQFISHFRQYGECDISGIIEHYADTPDSIPPAILSHAFNYLDSCGAFGSGDPGSSLLRRAESKSDYFQITY